MANLRQSLRQRAGLNDPSINNRTKSTYSRGINDYVRFCQDKGINKLKRTFDNPEKLIQEWVDSLAERGLKPDTIHTYLAPVAKAYDINMKEINKPKRTAADIEKGRNPVKNKRGQKERWSDRYKMSVQMAEATGLRRSELMKLTAADVCKDESGKLCVKTVGKGGKLQMQRILPEDVSTVLQIRQAALDVNDGIPDKPMLNEAQFSNNIPYHTIRREHAQRAYEYYLKVASDPKAREELKNELVNRWNAFHSENPKPDRRGRRRPSELILKTEDGWMAADPKGAAQRFLDEMEGFYVIRGDNRARAMKEGRPAKYDKLALLATSVFVLSHWRNDVSIRDYMM